MNKTCRALLLSAVSLLLISARLNAQQPQPTAGAPESSGVSIATSSGTTSPRLVKFSGMLQDASGKAVSGVVGITLALYQEQQGGTPLWIETQNVQADAQGNYTVLLGSSTRQGVPVELFTSGESRWLGVQAQTPGSQEQPRVLLVSVPYALKAADAETLGGLPASAFLRADPDNLSSGGIGTAGLANSSLVSGRRIIDRIASAATGGTGTTNRLTKWTDGAGGILDDTLSVNETAGGLVGIGTAAPRDSLEVSGSIRISGVDPQIKIHLLGDGAPRYQTGVSGAGGFQFQSLDAVTPRTFFLVSSSGLAFYQYGFETGNLTQYGKTGLGVAPLNTFDAAGGVAIGSYAGANTAPVNGLLVSGSVGIGTTTPGQKLTVVGTVESTSGGFKFPDGTTQTTAGGATDVICASPCIATGEIVDNAVTSAKIAADTITAGNIAAGGVGSSEITDLSILDADINASAAIAPSKILGTAATLGANAFTGAQTVAADLTVSGTGVIKGPLGMMLSNASFINAVGVDIGSAIGGFNSSDGLMEAQTGTTANSIDDTVGGVLDTTNLARTNNVVSGLNRPGAFLNARARWNTGSGTISPIPASHIFYILAGGARSTSTAAIELLSADGTTNVNGKYDGFGFKAVGSALKGVTIAAGVETVVDLATTLTLDTFVELMAIRRTSSVEFYVNGVLKGNNTTNLPTSASSIYEVRTQNGASTNNAIIQVDFLTVGIPRL